ncbi:FadR/GntR family transcriptional regulator [Mesorhizobium sp. CAU 1741]|uniref:FadR/GntR family transcriptional regulator n=1 Tax=Mesorhizobium sp. CAU 1741 TaxID=3140366 RepID=UPI00325A642D
MAAEPETTRKAAGTLSDQVYEQIYQAISHGYWKVGEKMPTEVELAERFGVSRPVLREALMRLRIDGVVESRQGAGTRVVSAPSRSVMEFAEPGSIADLQRCYEFRVGVEGEAAFMAAECRSEARIADIAEALEKLLPSGEEQALPTADHDIAFHVAVARATENSYYAQTIEAITQALHVGTRIARVLSHWSEDHRRDMLHTEHKRIYDAIAAGEPEQARQAMRAHIESARRRVFLGQ